MGLGSKKIVILVADDYEDIEFWYLYYRMEETGADVKVVGTVLGPDTLRGKRGYTVRINLRSDQVDMSLFDAVIIPGGWSSDRLSWCSATIDLIKTAFEQNKIVAAISQGGWILISANVLSGRSVTSASTIKDNMRNAGADWIDSGVIVDGNLITARASMDLPYFSKEIVKALESK